MRIYCFAGHTQLITAHFQINGYPSQSWMNFYLEYMDEIDRLIARRLEHKRSLRIQIDVTTAPQHLERLGSSIQAAVSNRPRATLAPSVTNPKLMPNTIGRISKRVYARALTPASKPSDRLEGSHSLPASNHGRDKTPSPPGRVIRITSGNLFTPEDTLFCLRFIKYKLARDPGLTVVQLCALLYEKVVVCLESARYTHVDLYITSGTPSFRKILE